MSDEKGDQSILGNDEAICMVNEKSTRDSDYSDYTYRERDYYAALHVGDTVLLEYSNKENI